MVDADTDDRINGFEEKPKETALRSPYNPEKVSASMGDLSLQHRCADSRAAQRCREPDSAHDFGKDILPKMVKDYRVYSFDFVDENQKEAQYWRDVGTLEAYYEANMDIVVGVAGVQLI